MPKASPIQNSFNAGELSPQLKGRVDLKDKYANGCETLENFLPQVHGPAKKRPGTRFVREVKDSSKSVRLLPFEYNTEQAYILEFGDTYIRFYKEGGIILDGGSPYEIVSPYAHTDLDKLQFAQSADVMYIAHPSYPPYKLARYGHTNWTITEVEFDWPPFNDDNVTSTTMSSSGTTGSVTLTASAAYFNADMVGGYFRFEEIIESKYSEWEAGESINSGDYRHYDGNLYKATSTATTVDRPPIHLEGTESDGGVDWEFQHNGAGYVEVTSYSSTTSVGGTVIKQLPSSATSGIKKWAEGAWSPNNGYPKSVSFYEDRLWFAGSNARPQTLWASTSGDYENHQYGTNDDDALNYTINSQDVNVIEWLMPGKVLAVGTSGGEFIVSASSLNEAITPTNVRIVPYTTYGSAEGIKPFKIGNAIIFVQRAGRKIRELAYQFETDSYVAPNMSILAEHVTQAGVVEMSYQQEPNQIVWTPCTCGTLIGMTYERAEEVIGWHRQLVGGSVKSVATIPHWDGDQDVLWMVVERTIDGSTVKYVEYLEKHYDDDYAFYVDSGLTYDGSPATTISGLDHLEGEEVAILADGYVHPNLTVASGQITLQAAASVINIGLPYTATMKTMPIEAGAADGIAQGKTMRINNIVMRLYETGPGLYYGPDVNNLDEYHMRGSTALMGSPVPLYTGDTKALPWPGEYQQAPAMTVQHTLPLPCTLIALMPQVTTYDRQGLQRKRRR